MKHGLTITIRNKKDELVTYEQQFVPTSKMAEYFQLTPDNYPDLDQWGWIQKNAEFYASCFDDKSVTRDALLNGVAIWDWNNFDQNISAQLMGVDPNLMTAENESPNEKPLTESIV